MDQTPNLALPYILAAQAQKHVTHNEAIRALDAIVQLSVLDRTLVAPPPNPAEGQRHIVAAPATGEWAGGEGRMAAFQDGAWVLYTPVVGWLAWIVAEARLVAWNGTAWADAATGSGGVSDHGALIGLGDDDHPHYLTEVRGDARYLPLAPALLGINAAADATNRLALKSDAVLLSHDDVTPGTGGLQLKINKAAPADTASTLFQTNFSGRAEMGLAGDDDFHFKVSGDGATWYEALVLDRTTGNVQFPKTMRANQAATTLQTLADGASIAWDCSAGGKAKVTLAGNRAVAAVSNAVEGAPYHLWVIQDATGSRLLTWATAGFGAFDFGAAGPPTLSTAAGSADLLVFEAVNIAGALKLRLVSFTAGFGGSGQGPYAGLTWAALGSSITSQGFYTAPLNTLLGTTLTNLGFSGRDLTTGQANSGIYDRIAQIPAGTDLVTFDGFINDFRHSVPLGALGDTATTTFYGALLSGATAVLAADPQRILAMFTHYETNEGGNPDWDTPNGNGNTLAQFNQAIRDVAAVVGAYLVDAAAESPVNHTTAATYLSDGLHLNTAGGSAQAQYLAGKIQAIQPYGGQAAAAPSFAPPAGTYGSAQSVTISSATAGAAKRYTTNGTTPDLTSPVAIGAVPVTASGTLRAIAVKSGFDPSGATAAAYTIGTTVATPTFAPGAGTYTSAQSVAISCATAGATIHYTTDGNDPTTSSPVYSAPINIAATTTLKALAVKVGSTNSAIASAAYTINTTVATPTFAPAAGTYTSAQSVAISCATAGATIHYTTDGNDPTTSSPVYSAPINIAATTTLKALAVKAGSTNSAIASAAYTINVATPTFAPAAGTYASAQSVAISCATAGATIHYTTDGNDPTTGSPVYSAPINVAATTTLKALAVKAGATNSAIASAAYTIGGGSFSPADLSPFAWFDFADTAAMFTDTAATTPVSANGQAIAAMHDKSGNTRHTQQVTSGNRPTYGTDGSHGWGTFNASHWLDIIAGTQTLTGGNWSIAWASRKAAATLTDSVIAGLDVSNFVGDNAATATSPTVRGAAVLHQGAAATAAATADHVSIVNCSAGTMTTYFNGAQSGTTLGGFTTWAMNEIGANNHGSYEYAGRIYEVVFVPRALTAGEVADLTAYLAAKMGLTI